MRSAFQAADARITDDNFLSMFRAYGCYLSDLSRRPIDHLKAPQRHAMRTGGEPFLAGEITRLQPEMIAPVLRSIESNVGKAVVLANWNGPILTLPYPGRWSRHREAFINALVPVIRGLRLGNDSAVQTSESAEG
jgi:hypothetical protein